jgi:hypothetical protein
MKKRKRITTFHKFEFMPIHIPDGKLYEEMPSITRYAMKSISENKKLPARDLHMET